MKTTITGIECDQNHGRLSLSAPQKTAQEGSVCEVERIPGLLDEAVQLIELVQMGRGKEGYLTRAKAAILMASKHLPSSPPSSEDTELLEWLESTRGTTMNQNGAKSLIRFEWELTGDLRAAIRAARAKEAQASTTSQKGGQGV